MSSIFPLEIIKKIINFNQILDVSFNQTCVYYNTNISTILTTINKNKIYEIVQHISKYLATTPYFINSLINLCGNRSFSTVLCWINKYYLDHHGHKFYLSPEQCKQILDILGFYPSTILLNIRPEVLEVINFQNNCQSFDLSEYDKFSHWNKIKNNISVYYLYYYKTVYNREYTKFSLMIHNQKIKNNRLHNSEIVMLYILALEHNDIKFIDKLYQEFPDLYDIWPSIPKIDSKYLIDGKYLFLHNNIDTNKLFHKFYNDNKFIDFLFNNSQSYIESYTNKPMFRLEKIKLDINYYDKESLLDLFIKFNDYEYYLFYKFDYHELYNCAIKESRGDIIKCLTFCKEKYPIFKFS